MKRKPQKGNPHQLTVNQHCFPRRSIERFRDGDGLVNVWLRPEFKRIRVAPEDQLFCARWVWDQRAETGFMADVERRFQALADAIERGRLVRRFSANENRGVTEMFLLWWIRSRWRYTPLPDERLEGVTGRRA